MNNRRRSKTHINPSSDAAVIYVRFPLRSCPRFARDAAVSAAKNEALFPVKGTKHIQTCCVEQFVGKLAEFYAKNL